MISTYLRTAAIGAAVLLMPIAAARAESILDHLPEDAIGFALVRNLEAANAKIEKVTQIFQEASPMPIPAPLPMLKAATGLGEGLNEQGDALLALLPGEEGDSSPRPLLLVAVGDYAAFAASVNGDASGEVCRVTIAGEEILVAKRGDYAVLMNVEHRDRLEAMLSSEAKPVAALEPLGDWLSKVDVAAVLTPSGVDMLTAMGRAGLASQRAAAEENFTDPQFAGSLKQLQQSFKMYDAVLGFLGAELEAAAAGVAIDDQSNVKLVSQMLLSHEGEPADVAATAAADSSPLGAYADKPYVLAAGGPIPPSYGDAFSSFMRNVIKANPEMYGFQNLTEQQWHDLEDSWKASMKGIRSMSMLLLPGEEDDPLYSNVYGVIDVDDAKEYLAANAEAMKKWNELLAQTTTDIKLQYEVSEVEVADKQGLLMTVDLGEVANDPNVPMVKSMMEAMFGEDGKMRMYYVPADENTVVMAISEEAGLKAIVDEVTGESASGLAKSSSVQTTVKLLDPQAPWLGVVSPKGTVAWVTRFYNKLLAQFGQGVPTIPEYPDSPPVGFSLNLAQSRLSTEMVWPAETLKGLASYIKKVQDSF